MPGRPRPTFPSASRETDEAKAWRAAMMAHGPAALKLYAAEINEQIPSAAIYIWDFMLAHPPKGFEHSAMRLCFYARERDFKAVLIGDGRVDAWRPHIETMIAAVPPSQIAAAIATAMVA